MNFVYLSLPVVFLFVSMFFAIRAVKRGRKKRSALAAQLLSFLAVCLIAFSVPAVAHAVAPVVNATPTETTAQTTSSSSSSNGIIMLAAALSTGLAAIGGGIAVAASAPAAIGATSEDPKAFGKALIFVALGEGIAIYGLLISILILNKV
jgi:V/A-type H+-transporting ATPase subunit K